MGRAGSAGPPPMIPIALTIVASTWAGLLAERRRPERAGLASRRALLLALYVVIPPVVFFNIAAAEFDADLGVGALLAVVTVLACTGAAYLAGSRLLGLRSEQTAALINCVLVPNTGYLGFPLVAATLGFDKIAEAVVFDLAVGIPGLLIGAFAVGAAMGTSAGEGARERILAFFTRNVPLYAAVVALIAPDALAPQWAVDASRIAVFGLLPVGFFAVGAALAEDAEEGALRLPPPFTPAVAAVVAIKLVLMPGLLLALAAPLIDLPTTFLVLAAMPSGLNAMVVAHAYGLDLRITAGALTWTTAIVVPIALVATLL